MLKTLKIATILTGVSAFAIPAFAQTSQTLVPSSSTLIEQNAAQTRNRVAEERPVDTRNPAANPTDQGLVPGSEENVRNNEAMERRNVAEDYAANGSQADGEGDDILVPGSGATFSPMEAPKGQNAVLQDQAVTQPN